jgi:AraC-like DNA-binding protein
MRARDRSTASLRDIIDAVSCSAAQIHVLNPTRPLQPDRAHPPLVPPDHHAYFELAICYEGEMSIVGHSETVNLKGGDSVVVKPGAWHYESYRSKSQPYRTCWPVVTPQQVHCIFTHYQQGKFITLHQRGLPQVDEIASLKHLAHEVEKKPPHWRTKARSLLCSLLVDLDRRLQGSQPNLVGRDVDPVKHLLRIVQARFREPLQIKTLAGEVGLSADHLSRRFHAASGVTFKDYLNTIRIHHAQLLLKSGWSIKKTADECGFSDVYYFGRVFKERCQTTPGKFVKEAKE